MKQPTNFTLLIVGDEILSGKRQDRHLAHVQGLLAARGLELSGVQIIGDDQHRLAEAIHAAKARGDVLLSCGGIGGTPDDCTRQAAAQAWDVPLVRHPEGIKLLEARYGEKTYPNRILMVEFPENADLIPNPINQVPGFSLPHQHFVPGFPEMAWPMLAWVLDTHYAHLTQAPDVELRLHALGNAAESDLLPYMEATLKAFAGIRFSSLPFRGDEGREPHIEFGIKGQKTLVEQAFPYFEGLLRQHGARVVLLP